MYRTTRYVWREPALYFRRTGIQKERRSVLVRVVLPVAFLMTGASLFAMTQVQHQLEAALKPTVRAEVASAQPIAAPKQEEKIVPASAAASEASINDATLQAILDDWSATHTAVDWSIAVKGLGNDKRSASVRSNSWYQPASLYKVLMLRDLFNRYSIESMASQKVWMNGTSASVKTCVEKMLRYSDNVCAEAIAAQLGWARIDATLVKLGLKQTQLNRKDAQFTNASDIATFMEGLYRGDFFNRAEREFILSNMQQGTWRKGIPAGCEGCVVANKTGDLPNVRHDAAIVNYKGGSYVLVIMTTGASYQQIAELTSKIHAHMVP